MSSRKLSSCTALSPELVSIPTPAETLHPIKRSASSVRPTISGQYLFIFHREETLHILVSISMAWSMWGFPAHAFPALSWAPAPSAQTIESASLVSPEHPTSTSDGHAKFTEHPQKEIHPDWQLFLPAQLSTESLCLLHRQAAIRISFLARFWEGNPCSLWLLSWEVVDIGGPC